MRRTPSPAPLLLADRPGITSVDAGPAAALSGGRPGWSRHRWNPLVDRPIGGIDWTVGRTDQCDPKILPVRPGRRAH